MALAVNTTTAEKHQIDADRFERDIGIPPRPAILTQLGRTVRSKDADIRRVERLLRGDVGLSAAILKLANSPFYGARRKAASVGEAIVFLGLDAVSRLVAGLLLKQAFPGGAVFRLNAFWETSASVAGIASAVARETHRAGQDLAYTYALFRDCGMPVMLGKLPGYAGILDGSSLGPGDRIVDVEQSRYQTNHARIGFYFAKSWFLPESICLAIWHHHDLFSFVEPASPAGEEAAMLGAIGLIAEEIHRRAAGDTVKDWAVAGAWALDRLGWSEDDMSDFSARAPDLTNESA